jgi:hypothetical protein
MDYSKVQNLEVEGVDMADYPDFVDAYAIYAEAENGVVLNEEQLDVLNTEYSDIVQKFALNSIF